MIEKVIVVAPTTAVPMSTGFAVALNVLPAPSLASSRCLARSNFAIDAVILLQLSFDVGNIFDQRQLIDGLSIVSNRAVGIDGDGDRTHTEEAEGHKAKGEDGWSKHHARRIILQIRYAHTEVIAESHECDHAKPQPVGRKIAGHKSGKDSQ